MKKKIIVPVLFSGMVLLGGCECKHKEWTEATCSSPKTCVECKVTEGEPLKHKWEDATIEKPKTCSMCGETEGEPLSPADVLLDEDKLLFEAMIDLSSNFKNPSSIRLLQWNGESFCVISGENSFGGTTNSTFYFEKEEGVLIESSTMIDLGESSKKESVSKINFALAEYFKNQGY